MSLYMEGVFQTARKNQLPSASNGQTFNYYHGIGISGTVWKSI
nr:MAG TPA_asm: hypothetical protein [Caudoviricetes sp.]